MKGATKIQNKNKKESAKKVNEDEQIMVFL